jgi:hypothetical protein
MQNSGSRNSGQKDAARKNADKYFGGGAAASPAKAAIDAAKEAADANTMRLRALRLAKEAADKTP